ncbi:MAG: TVP38/TMEM64 family protein [Nitrospirota bacterium]
MRPIHSEKTGASAKSSPSLRRAPALGKLLVALLLAAGVITFFFFDLDRYLSLETLKAERNRLLAFTEQHYAATVSMFVILYCLQTTLSLPGAAIFTLAGGFLFGPFAGTLYANIGATSGAVLAFLVARYLLHDWVEAKFGQRLQAFQKGFAKNSFGYLLSLRLIPVFPFFIINLLSGLTRISLGAFVAATALGIIPASFVYAYAGRQLATINSLGEIASPPVLLAFTLLGALALIPAFYQRMTKKPAGTAS